MEAPEKRNAMVVRNRHGATGQGWIGNTPENAAISEIEENIAREAALLSEAKLKDIWGDPAEETAWSAMQETALLEPKNNETEI